MKKKLTPAKLARIKNVRNTQIKTSSENTPDPVALRNLLDYIEEVKEKEAKQKNAPK